MDVSRRLKRQPVGGGSETQAAGRIIMLMWASASPKAKTNWCGSSIGRPKMTGAKRLRGFGDRLSRPDFDGNSRLGSRQSERQYQKARYVLAHRFRIAEQNEHFRIVGGNLRAPRSSPITRMATDLPARFLTD